MANTDSKRRLTRAGRSFFAAAIYQLLALTIPEAERDALQVSQVTARKWSDIKNK